MVFRLYIVALAIFAVALPGASKAQTFAPLTACDEYAADPHDTLRVSEGVSSTEVKLAIAEESCVAAVSQYPQNGRLQFQLSRIHLLNGQTKLALEGFYKADKLGYPTSSVYIGAVSAVKHEGKDEKAYQTAIELLGKAVDFSGYSDADALIASIRGNSPVAGQSEQGSQQMESASAVARYKLVDGSQIQPQQSFNPSGFQQGELLKNLFEGEMSKINKQDIGVLHYIKFFNDAVSASGFGVSNPACLALYVGGMEGAIANNAMQGAGFGGSSDDFARRGFELFANSVQDMMNNNFRGMIAGAANKEAMIKGGTQDAVMLAQRYGCDHPVSMAIYGNLSALFLDTPVTRPPWLDAQRRMENYRLQAAARCEAGYSDKKFCGCMIKTLESETLNERAWNEISSDFNSLLVVAPAVDGFRDKLRACY